MKKLLLLILMACSSAASVAQAGLDVTYGNNGKAVLPALGGLKAQWGTIEVLANGSSLLAGFVQKAGDKTDGVVMKILANGQPDLGFGTNGLVLIDNYPKEYIRKMLLLGNGKVLLIGNFVSPTTDRAFIMTLDSNGVVSAPGEINRKLTGYGVYPISATLTTNGDILVGGYAYNPANDSRDFLIFKLKKSSYSGMPVIDANFGNGGSVFYTTSDYSPGYTYNEDRGFQLISKLNGKILVAGYSNKNDVNDRYAVFQLTPTGQPDNEFSGPRGMGGIIKPTPNSTGDRAYAAALQPDGKVVVVGTSKVSNKEFISIIRIDERGEFDNTFDGDGRAYFELGASTKAYDVKIGVDGKIWIAGATRHTDYTYRNLLLRLLPNGARDLSVADKGLFIHPASILTDFYGSTYTVKLAFQADGKVLTAAAQTNNAYLLARWSYDPFIAYFTTAKTDSIPICGTRFIFTPSQITENHNHVWDFGDGSQTSFRNEDVAIHWYLKEGTYTVKHWLVLSPGDSAVYTTNITIGKSPNVAIRGDMLMPFGAPVTLFDSKYPDETHTGKYGYRWESPLSTLPTTEDPIASFQYAAPGIYTVKLLVFDRTEPSCQQVIETKLFMAAASGECGDMEDVTLGQNLTPGGNFTLASCPAGPDFATGIPWYCSLDGTYHPGKVAVVSDALQSGFPKSSSSIPQLDGKFLLITGSDLNQYPSLTILNRYAWVKEVPVQAGTKYRFKANLAELSSLLLDQYNFSEIILLVDNKPLTLTWNSQGICADYLAAQTKQVEIAIIKVEGFRVFNGSIGIDNIVFAPILQSAPNAREDMASNATDNVMERELTVSPNPATEVLKISYLHSALELGHVEILDSYTGRVVRSMPMTSSAITIPLNDLASGMYLAKLYASNGSILGTKKFLAVK